MAAGFDRIAPVYQLLTRIIFGNVLQRAQLHFIARIRSTDTILILGGGDGTFLKALLAIHPNLHIDYIDISPRMIALAQRKTVPSANVNFIVGTEQDIPNTSYSVVITNFYLDLFSDKKLKSIIEKIKGHLHPHARWLATDFVSEKWWHKLMLWVMYRFFNVTTGIEARQLPDWQQHLARAIGGNPIQRKFYQGFITTAVFTR